MNALTRAARTQVPRFTGRRTIVSDTFKKDWLSDPSTYPIIGVIGGACTLATCFITYKITQCPDVKIAPKNKNSVLRAEA